MVVSDENAELVERHIAAMRSNWDRGDPWRGVIAPFFEEGIEYYPVRGFPESRNRHGIEELASFMEEFGKAWETIDSELIELTAVGDDRVLARVRLSGEGRGSGARLEGDVFWCYWVRNGRIFRQEDHLTEEGARRALGVAPDQAGVNRAK